jgi:hypothetical protein
MPQKKGKKENKKVIKKVVVSKNQPLLKILSILKLI